MNIKNLLIDFVIVFAATLVVTPIVTYLYSLIVYGAGVCDWGLAFRLAIIFGIVLSLINARERKKKEK